MIIAVINEKGGVGKTTTAVNLAEALARKGHLVHAVNLDRKGTDEDEVADLMSFQKHVSKVIFSNGSAKTLRKLLQSVPADYHILDCPPKLGPASAAALKVADLALVTITPEYLPVMGLKRVLATIETARDPRRRDANANLQVKLLITMWDTRATSSNDLVEQLRRRFATELCATAIKLSPLIKDSTLAHQSILEYAPRCPAATAYRALAKEIKEMVPID